MDSPVSRPCGGAQVAPPADGLVLYRSARSSHRSVQSSQSNELPAGCPETIRMSGKGANKEPSGYRSVIITWEATGELFWPRDLRLFLATGSLRDIVLKFITWEATGESFWPRDLRTAGFVAMARGRAPWTEFPLLSLPVRDASRRRRPPR